ncbi:hypothetical protein [Helicovermis profundi]|uniref:Uncharacterized protein n=1 Tax=Helicovermis profundi TaxID=3065157 RepID=A0AAU9EER5_9FIRM|nr:hypothetical protein HLPR_15230 [Clostridia bacterium S502]
MIEKIYEVYNPIVKKFSKNIANITDINNLSAPHIPGIGTEYMNAKLRICYLGIDTLGWISIEEAMNNYDYYIGKTTVCLSNTDHIGQWSDNGKRSPFWRFVFNMQFRLNDMGYLGFETNLNIESNNKSLNAFAWGNTNALEKMATLNKKSKVIDKKKYNELKMETGIFDNISNFSYALNPDIYIVMNWGDRCGLEEFIGESNIVNREELNEYVWKLTLKDNRLLYWTLHPRGMSFKGGYKKYLEIILNSINNHKSHLNIT